MSNKFQQHYFHYFRKWGMPFLRWKNNLLGRKKLLVYTDSRGINIPKHYYYTHYPIKLARKYAVTEYLVPYKSTTLVDFLGEYEKNEHWKNDFDLIILHLGVVDFSPRPVEQIHERIYPNKKEYFDWLFGEDRIKAYHATTTGIPFYGKDTQNLYSLEMAKESIIPKLQQIPNLVFIGGNKIVPKWRGNYWRDRPENLNMVEPFFRVFDDALKHTIDLLHWSHEEVKERTYDIIHFNEKGSDYILDRVEEKINELLFPQKK